MNGTEHIKTISYANQVLGLCPQAGGAIAFYRTEKPDFTFDWLRPANPAAVINNNALEMANFPLVPFSNRIKNSRFEFKGRTVKLSPNMEQVDHVIHGHGLFVPWELERHTGNEIVLTYAHKVDSWPWSYTARQIFTLDETGLTIMLEIINSSNTAMPVGFGHHFFFNRTEQANIKAQTQKMWENDTQMLPTKLVTPAKGKNPANGIIPSQTVLDNVYTNWCCKAEIEWPEHKTGLTMTADNPLDFLVIYTPENENFFCVEPVSHSTDAFNAVNNGRTDTGFIALSPQSRVAARVRLHPRENKPGQ